MNELRRAAQEYGYQELNDWLNRNSPPGVPPRRRMASVLWMLFFALSLITVGGKTVTEIFVGNTPVSEVYVGNNKVWPDTTCDPNPGAPAGSPTSSGNNFEFTTSQTISNRIYAGNRSDDLINVTAGKVIFDHVTFIGNGTGSSGSTVGVSFCGAVEIRN